MSDSPVLDAMVDARRGNHTATTLRSNTRSSPTSARGRSKASSRGGRPLVRASPSKSASVNERFRNPRTHRRPQSGSVASEGVAPAPRQMLVGLPPPIVITLHMQSVGARQVPRRRSARLRCATSARPEALVGVVAEATHRPADVDECSTGSDRPVESAEASAFVAKQSPVDAEARHPLVAVALARRNAV